jgi:hypothetical protein
MIVLNSAIRNIFQYISENSLQKCTINRVWELLHYRNQSEFSITQILHSSSLLVHSSFSIFLTDNQVYLHFGVEFCKTFPWPKGFSSHLGDPGEEGSIILKWILEKQDAKLWNKLVWKKCLIVDIESVLLRHKNRWCWFSTAVIRLPQGNRNHWNLR